MYQLHQIALNNYNDCASLLMQKYMLPAPENSNEMITAVDYAAENFGDQFVNDIANIQSQKNAITQNEMAYKNQLDTSNVNQLKEELVRLNLKLTQEIESREYILDKIAYVQKLIIQKTESVIAIPNIHKNNQLLLIGLAAFALMFIGSKIFKQ